MNLRRLRIEIQGAVQGVGFRPFIWRLANELDIHGWIQNTSRGVQIDAEGDFENLRTFLLRIPHDKPRHAILYSLKHQHMSPKGYTLFEIIPSDDQADKQAWILPDIATCSDCLDEIFDPANRRYLYPFTNCTHCGPRFSIIERLPYDRRHTSMKMFTMCPRCQKEYDSPDDRRFHAQPNACPECGPHVELWDSNGVVISQHNEALEQCVALIKQGKILAIKGLGGFHLVVDAENDWAVNRLRTCKGRDEKPFALMIPDVTWVEEHCSCSDFEKLALLSPESPIVILHRNKILKDISAAVAPRNPLLGVMLPYTPLHHILIRALGRPFVATSGNLADETICITNEQALHRLGNLADYLLVHNRPISHHVDDSIVRVMAERQIVLRRARGFAPLPLNLHKDIPPAIAVGGHLKNTIAVANGRSIFVSQHIGDLETEDSCKTMEKTVADFERLYNIDPHFILHDLHPDYVSTHYAKNRSIQTRAIQHHIAHVLSCMAENELQPPVLGVSWDGTGYGWDGTIWGGEFFIVSEKKCDRYAHFRTFPLPGGSRAVKEPCRTALGLACELPMPYRDSVAKRIIPHVKAGTADLLFNMVSKNINSPVTSSVGRLFDAVASILNIQHINRYEGQAAMLLEYQAWEAPPTDASYQFVIHPDVENHHWIIDWEKMILGILEDREKKIATHTISAKFHNTLVAIIKAIVKKSAIKSVVLSGGAFQNKYLTEATFTELQREGVDVATHQQVPPNDGGISLGQLASLTYLKQD